MTSDGEETEIAKIDEDWADKNYVPFEQGKTYHIKAKLFYGSSKSTYSFKIIQGIRPTGFTHSLAKTTIELGELIRIGASFTPADASYREGFFSLTNGQKNIEVLVTSYDVPELVRGNKLGAATYTTVLQADAGIKDSFTITVKEPTIKGTITSNSSQDAVFIGSTNTVFYQFTPTISEAYTFYSKCNRSTFGTLYDNEFNLLQSTSSGIIRRELEAGKTYYIGFRISDYNYYTEQVPVTICVDGVTKAAAELEDTPEKWEKAPEEEVKTIETIKMDYKKLTLAKGKKFKLSYDATPVDNNDIVTWTSSNPKYVSVDKNGVVKAKVAGKRAVIRATTSTGVVTTCIVKVPKKEIKSESVKVKKNKATLEVGDEFRINATIYPRSSTDNKTFKYSNEKVAQVTSRGLVTAVGKGKAKITVKTTSGKKATVTVVVK